LAKHDRLDVPASKLKLEICKLLQEQGYIENVEVRDEDPVRKELRISLRYTNAGHNAPVLVRKDGRVELLEHGGLLLGVFPEATYEVASVELDPGDVLALYTDGVTEASNPDGDMFSEERLVENLVLHREASAPELHRRLLAEVQRFQAGNPPDDDLTLVLVKRLSADGAGGNGARAGGAA